MTRRVFLAAPVPAQSMSYTEQIEQWRRDRQAALKADDGYLCRLEPVPFEAGPSLSTARLGPGHPKVTGGSGSSPTSQ